MKKSNYWLVFGLIFTITLTTLNPLHAENYRYKISCLGVRVVDIDISNYRNQMNGVLRVDANSHFITSIFPYVHNTYLTNYEEDYLPISYEKHIDQKKYFENRISTYDRENKTAVLVDKLKNQTYQYSIMPSSRDFFSALLFISNHLKDKDDIWLDANKLIWTVSYVEENREVLKTSLGRLPAIKLKMRFKKVSKEPKENTDMLTNQLVNENNTLYLWISDDARHLPLKAKYERKPFPVYWDIISFKP